MFAIEPLSNRPPRINDKHLTWVLGLILSLLLPAAVLARDTLYLLDVSQAMAEPCPGRGSSLYVLAIERMAAETANAPRGDQAAVVTYGPDTRMVADFKNANTLTLDDIPKPRGTARSDALEAALDTARRQLLRRTGREPARIVVFGTGELTAAGPQLTQQVGLLRSETPDIAYVAVGRSAAAATPLLLNLFPQVERLSCGASRAAAGDDPGLGRLRQLASGLSGIDPAMFGEDADFITDLGIDRLTAFEIVARACAESRVRAPRREGIVTLRALADYLASAERLPPPDRLVRGDDRKGDEKVQVQQVFFGTDRKRLRRQDPGEMFTGERASRGRITYGYCEVTIPVDVHKRGELETPWMSLDFLADPQEHVILRKAGILDKRRFLRMIGDKLSAGRGQRERSGDLLIFIHGFNVSFENAARRTAQVAYDLDFKGVPAFFSWPSNGAFSAYVSDREDVEWSVPHIAEFLSDVAASVPGARVHVIAHSMGHEGLLRALNQLALQGGRNKAPLFENVIMAAPDFDAEIFADQLSPRIGFLARHWTLYASDKDVALNISSSLRSAERLGLPLTVVPDVVTVDATGVEVTPWSVPEFHSYYATKQRVITDIVSVLKGVAPAERNLSRALRGKMPYWRLSGIQ